jgi:lipoprotein-anchoring transpeptidase ErfK/SrfK
MILVSPGDPGRPVAPDAPITVTSVDGRLVEVEVRDQDGAALTGALDPSARSWSSTDALLRFGGRYSVTAAAIDESGVRTTTSTEVAVVDPERVSASLGVADGATVGIGMPMIVRLSRAPDDRAAVERRLSVRATPSVQGSWSWVGAREVHWRPRAYWQPGTTVEVRADLEGVRVGQQQWGLGEKSATVRIGRAAVFRVGVDTHRMDVLIDGALVRTIPITTGKPGFITRNGVKVIMSKERSRRMRSETVGIAEASREGYDLEVEYAMRLTNSGEFIHAAPWSVSSQGRNNVSHGCTGMSTANAAWLYSQARPGDVVEYTGSPRPMTATNGYGDWNVSWSRWTSGSALA